MILINGTEIKPTIFPDKTSQVWKLDPALQLVRYITITWKFENEGEFMQLAQLVTLLRAITQSAHIALDMPFLPYGRQDKAVSLTTTFALRTFAGLVNFLNFDAVTSFDPHSDVSNQVIQKFRATYPVGRVKELRALTGADYLCYPDRGAFEKYHKMFMQPFIQGAKVRNESTGEITSYSITAGEPKDKKILIVDDICDGGATFINLTRALLDQGANEVYLYVSHGIFSKGTKILKEAGIKKIFTKEGEAQ